MSNKERKAANTYISNAIEKACHASIAAALGSGQCLGPSFSDSTVHIIRGQDRKVED